MTLSLRSLASAYLVSALLLAAAVGFLLYAQPAKSQPLASDTPVPVADSTRSAADSPDASNTTDPSDGYGNAPYSIAGRYVHAYGADHVGASTGRPYFSESVLYRDPPPIRYNRVEGLTIGLQRSPLNVYSDDRARAFGQIAFATELNRFRFTGGVEARVYQSSDHALKVGAKGYQNTFTEDDWKTSYLENSLGGLIFGHDFFNYFEARGAQVYAVYELPATLQVSAGLRTELNDGLRNRTGWSIFDGDGFSENPAAMSGRSSAALFAVEAGRVKNLKGLPTGGALRVSAELGSGLSAQDDWLDTRATADLAYNRFTADGRVYLPTSDRTRLVLRVRGGYATSETPVQKQFFLGGIGSVRGYGQNAFVGTRSLLGNAEFIVDGATLTDDLFDDVFLAVHADAGWTGRPGDSFRIGDVLPAAGFGIGLDERAVRLDVTWPLKSVNGSGYTPSIWLRITPNF